ncbi:DNA-binding protein [Streptomyces orinoci]|uniref:Helix-turn-helix domain-containing protein n=1 Tax=Streptomyces orinoci TaxID=67339 RepID=A0ABV3K362_STRON|nr:DNA-binding protein [Streptomyces orinoci]
MTDAQPTVEAAPPCGVTHIRYRHTKHFTVVGNHLAQHPDLSAVAIGLGVYIQSLPNGAPVGIKDLVRRFREGEIVIARALRELESAGYLERTRVRTGAGRVMTRTRWYERPGAPPPPVVDLVKRRPARKSEPVTAPDPLPPVDEPAAELLAGLRRLDPRLLLSEKDVRRLSPAVRTWLNRGVGPAQIARTLTAELPPTGIGWPARLVGYRLTNWLPPALPVVPVAPRPQRPVPPLPFQTCDGCERAFRASAPGRCRECREAMAEAS